MTETVLAPALELPVGSIGHRGVGYWGLVFAIVTESALFAYLLFSYYYCAVQLGPNWLPGPPPPLKLALPNTIILLMSSVSAFYADHQVRHGARGASIIGLAITVVLGVAFFLIQLMEWHAQPFSISSGTYGSLYFTITGFHLAHVAAGLMALAFVLAWSALGYFDRRRHVPVLVAASYWHFVDAVWLAVFFTFYISPRLW